MNNREKRRRAALALYVKQPVRPVSHLYKKGGTAAKIKIKYETLIAG